MKLEKEQTQQNKSRRDFLKMGSMAALGMTLPLNQSFALSTSAKNLRVGIVGGRFGCSFQFHEHPNCIVEAVSDLRPERRNKLIETYKCSKSYNSLEELVKDKHIDAVAVFTEGPNHVKHVLECLKHCKHVLCAVPAIWGSITEAEMLFEAVKKSGLIYMMAEPAITSSLQFLQGISITKVSSALFSIVNQNINTTVWKSFILKTENVHGDMVWRQCIIQHIVRLT